jgi:hypothetical protein
MRNIQLQKYINTTYLNHIYSEFFIVTFGGIRRKVRRERTHEI